MLHVDQHHVQTHQLHPLCAKTSPPSTPAMLLPESHRVSCAFHSLCPIVAFTAAPAQHCKAGVAPALGSDLGLSRCACQHRRPCSLQNPAGLALRGHPHQCSSLGTWWESSKLGLWGGHPSQGAHVDGDSVSVTPVACAILSGDDVAVFLHSPVTSSAGGSLRPAQQQTEPSAQEEPEAPSSCCQTHQFVTSATKPFGETESFPTVTAYGSREGKTCCLLIHIHCS